ncbi:unnamed protein product [Moneuplotes crassus]|uniref:Uncharacterized protein n=1 Tax=Euplotes crassus TaxID=5936 RepID=A0AAD1Y2Z4_EUPCR|nr:unnamed protein product [Moneuplotes crassus]
MLSSSFSKVLVLICTSAFAQVVSHSLSLVEQAVSSSCCDTGEVAWSVCLISDNDESPFISNLKINFYKRSLSIMNMASGVLGFWGFGVLGLKDHLGVEIEEEEYSITSKSGRKLKSHHDKDCNVVEEEASIHSIPSDSYQTGNGMKKYLASRIEISKKKKGRNTHYRESSLPYPNPGKKPLRKIPKRIEEFSTSRRNYGLRNYGIRNYGIRNHFATDSKPRELRRQNRLNMANQYKKTVVTKKIQLDSKSSSDCSENSEPCTERSYFNLDDECSPNTSINDLVPKLKRLITKKIPSHMVSLDRRKELKKLDSSYEGNILETANVFIRSPLKCNLSNNVNNSGEFQSMNFNTKVPTSARLTNVPTYHTKLEVKNPSPERIEQAELPQSLPPPKRKYPEYLDEDRTFTYVANWARLYTEKRLPTYVAPQYKDNRPVNRKRPQLVRPSFNNIKGDRVSSYCGEAESTEDYTKRTVRRGHFQDEDVEYIEIELNEPQEITPNTGNSTTPEVKILQKSIGYWCQHCFELILDKKQSKRHLSVCEFKNDKESKYIRIIKRKFKGFSKSLEDCYEKIQIENSIGKKNFFNTPSSMFMDNLVKVFDKVYDRYSGKFYCNKQLKLLGKKVRFIHKDISVQKQNLSYPFTLATKAIELMDEYIEFRCKQ